jgi:hypothetical protein
MSFTASSELCRTICWEEFKIIPDMTIGFRLFKGEAIVPGVEYLVQTLLTILRTWPGDCVFQFEETPYLVRKDAAIAVLNFEQFWSSYPALHAEVLSLSWET